MSRAPLALADEALAACGRVRRGATDAGPPRDERDALMLQAVELLAEAVTALRDHVRDAERERAEAAALAAVPVRYTYPEAAQRLRISERTLRTHVAVGDIRPLRIGARVVFTEEQVEAFERDAAAGRLRHKPRLRRRSRLLQTAER